MVRLVRAIFENGVFRPIEAMEGLPDRTTVNLRVEHPDTGNRKLSDFFGIWDVDEAERIKNVIEAEFV